MKILDFGLARVEPGQCRVADTHLWHGARYGDGVPSATWRPSRCAVSRRTHVPTSFRSAASFTRCSRERARSSATHLPQRRPRPSPMYRPSWIACSRSASSVPSGVRDSLRSSQGFTNEAPSRRHCCFPAPLRLSDHRDYFLFPSSQRLIVSVTNSAASLWTKWPAPGTVTRVRSRSSQSHVPPRASASRYWSARP